MLEAQQYAREVRNRLRNPANGRVSSDLDVVPEYVAKRRKSEAGARAQQYARQERERQSAELMAEYKRKLDNWVARGAEEPWEQTIPTLTMTNIIRETCLHLNIKRVDLFSSRRTARPVRARHIAMYIARQYTTLSFPEIGRRLGGRDHTTVLSGVQKLTGMLAAGDAELEADIAAIKKALGAE